MKHPHIAVIVGSLRKDSFSRKTALAFIALAGPDLEFEMVGIGDLPLYNQDLEENAPAAWIDFRRRLAAAAGVLFFTPEHNRSVPAALKNALDVGSRPYGQSVWNGKPGAIVSVSPGKLGGFGANHHLRQSLVFLNVPVMAQPEAYLGEAPALFDGDDGFKDESTRSFASGFMRAFAAWAAANTRVG
jgi:chromate reductase, NAD(P)H dehydrogenase (quinone)